MRKAIFILCWLLLSACDNNAVDYSTYDSEALDISFEYPELWVLDANALEANVATDESLFAIDTADFSGGAVVNFSSLPLEAVNGDLEVALGQFTSFVAANEAVEEVGDVEILMVNGREAAQARLNLTEEATLLVTMIRGESQVILIAAVYDEAQYEKMIVHMVESVTFME